VKVHFTAKQIPTGIPGNLMLETIDSQENDRLTAFLKAKRAKEKTTGEERYLDVQLEIHYKRRSLNANNLHWELCTRIAQADDIDKDIVHAAVKEAVYPREEHYGIWHTKEGKELSTVEFAQAIDWLIRQAVDRADPVDIRDIWILFTEWRYGQAYDPVKYADLEEYKEAHPLCECCWEFLLQRDQEGVYRHIGHISHILSRGAGGADTPANVFVFCSRCHQNQHVSGWGEVVKRAGFLEQKIKKALAIHPDAGQEVVDDFQDDIPWEDPGIQPAHDSHQDPPAQPEVLETDEPKAQEHPAEIVRRVFGGTVVEGTIPSPAGESSGGQGDVEKQKLISRLQNLEKDATEKQQRYYGKEQREADGQQELLTDPVDPKKAQYKDD
jgi:5-methylcytosine-specific restriction endonuclease McrA